MGKFKIVLFFLFTGINCYSQIDSIEYYSNELIKLNPITEVNKNIHLKNLKNLSRLEISKGNFQNALMSDKRIVDLTKTYFGEESAEYFKAVYDYSTSNLFVGVELYKNKEYEKSIAYLSITKNNYEKFGFNIDEIYLLALQFLGLSSSENKNFSNAINYYLILIKNLEQNNQSYPNFNISQLLQLTISIYLTAIWHNLDNDDLEGSKLFLKQMKEFYKNRKIPEEENIIQAYKSIALKLSEKNNHNEALYYFKELSEITKNRYGEKSIEYGESLISIATCLNKTEILDDNTNAIIDYQTSGINILKNLNNSSLDKKIYKYELNLLFYLYWNFKYEDCIILANLIESKSIDFDGINSFSYFSILSNKGKSKLKLGLYIDGEKDLMEANRIFENLDDNDYLYLTNIEALADYYAFLEDYDKAMASYENYVNRSRDKYENDKSNKILLNNYLVAIGRIAHLNSIWGDFNWEYFYRMRQIELYEKENLEDQNYVVVLSNLISTSIHLEKNSEILELTSKVIKSLNKVKNENLLRSIHFNLYSAFNYLGKNKEANEHFQLSFNFFKKSQNKLTDREKLEYLSRYTTYHLKQVNNNDFFHELSEALYNVQIILFDNVINDHLFKLSITNKVLHLYPLLSYLKNSDTLNLSENKSIFENVLIYQNLSLRNQTRIRQTILEQGDQKTKELYQSYINNNNRLIRLETEFTEESIAEYKRLSEINENIEKELIKHSAEFADAQKDLQIQWTDLRDKLAPNEAIVDLVSFNLFEDDWTDKIQYAAFIVRKNSDQPEFVSLFEEKELSSLLSLQNHDSIYQSDKLYQLFIKPIENKLSGINTLYYSPSGLAHQIDFSAIALPGDDQMLDKYKIHLLSTPAQLRKFKELALYSNSEIILFGDIDYDKEIHQNSDKQLNETELHSLSDLLTRSGIGGWSYLPGTKKEVELIEHSAKEKLIKTKVYKGSEATKESLMTLSGKTEPFVLHLATHGFFFENTVQELPENFLSTRSFGQMVQVSENPMLRSGLVLSGANKSWHKDTSGKGIVTAAEIANLDLRNCDLVVLSACDTGLGDINGSEGVYGLQRAFKLAGVKNIIMSLWKVPDAQTSEMFELFYQELLNGKSIHQSFVEAQTKMKEKYSPYYWAGFVLLE